MRQMTTAEMSASGEATPQDIRNRQLRDANMARERKRFGAVPDQIRKAVAKTNPNRQLEESEVNEFHREAEGAFVKELVLTDPDKVLDSDVVPVSMGRIREMARRYADAMLEVAANDTRVFEMRRELAAQVDDKLDGIGLDILSKLSPMLADATRVGMTLKGDIYRGR